MPTIKDITAKLDAGRQYRDFNLSRFEHRAEDDGAQIVEGYATVFNTEYELWHMDNYTVLEQIDPKAFDDCDMSDVIMQYNHEGRVFARISNGTLTVAPDATGLFVRADLGGTDLGRQLYQEIDGGYTNKMSFGFTVSEDQRVVTEDHDTGAVTVLRTITKINKLFDVSAVSIPANDATSISARNYGEGVIAEVREEIEKRKARRRQQQKIKILTEVK